VTRRVLGTAALFAAVVLLVGAFVFFGFVIRGQIDSFKEQIAVLVGVVGAAATVAAGVGGISARVVQNGAAGALDRLLQHGGTFDTIATRIEVSLEQERSRAAVERDALFSQLTAASERLAAARQSLRIAELERRELVTSDPIPRLLAEYRSLASGSETGASRSLLITLRSDLEALSSLAQVSAQGRLAAYEDSAGLPFPARVVVYVDDLDVCPPNKVVESLETIQTMLRFPMFVAAVSADPTKLQEAIAPWYGMSLDDERRSSDGVDAFFAKVFTFHIWLRQPTAEIARLLMALLPGTAEEVLSPQEVASAVPGTAEEDLSPQEVDSAVPGTAEEDLSPQEIESAVSVAHLLKTPRDARRFVYNYLAARTLVGSSRLQSAEGGCRPLMLLLAVGVSRPDLGWELASAVAPGADSDAAYLSFRERFLREVEPDQLVQEIVDALDDAHPDLTNWARVAQRFSFRGSP
jgi:hypothetical protein